MNDVVVIDGQLFEVKDGEKTAINLKTTAAQVTSGDGSVADALVDMKTAIDAEKALLGEVKTEFAATMERVQLAQESCFTEIGKLKGAGEKAGEDLAAHDERLAAVEEGLAGLKIPDVEKLAGDLAEHGSRLQSVEETATELAGKQAETDMAIAGIRTKLEELEGGLDNVNTALSGTASKQDALEGEIDALKGDCQEAAEKVAAHDSAIAGLGSRLDTLDATIGQNKSQADTAIATLTETQQGQATLAENLETEIDTIRTRLDAIIARLDALEARGMTGNEPDEGAE